MEVKGYKSVASQGRLPLAGLTLLAGANSSGKSSFMQPLLLLKQTLECPYDPGAILLDGANVKITATDQMISRIKTDGNSNNGFSLKIGTPSSEYLIEYRKGNTGFLRVDTFGIKRRGAKNWIFLKEGEKIPPKIVAKFGEGKDPLVPTEMINAFTSDGAPFEFTVSRDRCFLKLSLQHKSNEGARILGIGFNASGELPGILKKILHIPGLRGNPERTYSATEVGNNFPGTYEHYVASILWKWQTTGDAKLTHLGDQLRSLGLTWKIAARKIQDTRVELRVGRLPRPAKGGARDLVSLADVGLGVAQTLPLLVAMLSASRGQIVYIEQPELHLHPRAQWRMAEIVRDAVNRGVRIVIETHSSVFLRGLQTQIALKKMKSSDTRFNWFTRDPSTGSTVISSVVPDKNGAVGDWPSDFDDVGLEVEGAYLDAVGG